MDRTVVLMETPLNAATAHAEFLVSHGHHGAVAAFTGVVRGENGLGDGLNSGRIDHLHLDWYPGMTEASLDAIADAAAQRFDIRALGILHRCGEVQAGEPVVFVAAAARHRRAAFDAVDYMMDRLKSEAALWKREAGPDGERWVEPTQEDGDALKRWP